MPGATKSFWDWRGRSTSVSRPKFCFDWSKRSTCDRWRNRFSDWRERSKMTTALNFCAWRDRKFFWLARPKQNSPGTAFFASEVIEARATADQNVFASGALKNFRLVWPKHKFPPTEVYLRLARPKNKWQPTAILLRLRWLQHEWTRTEVFSRLARPIFFAIGTIETKVSADFIFFAIGASDSRPKFFCAWSQSRHKCPPTENLLWLVQRMHLWPLTELF